LHEQQEKEREAAALDSVMRRRKKEKEKFCFEKDTIMWSKISYWFDTHI